MIVVYPEKTNSYFYQLHMANRIKIKKGLQIPLLGKPEETLLGSITSEYVQVVPEDFQGITPKLKVKVGDAVKAGQALFFSKMHPEHDVCISRQRNSHSHQPRGEKRRILNVYCQKPTKENTYVEYGKSEIGTLPPEEIKKRLLDAGIWFVIKQRPYDVVADPGKEPRDIFVTGFDTAPLAPSYDFILKGQEADLQTGLNALARLTKGKVFLSISPATKNEGLRKAANVTITEFEGPHPAGNTGTHINYLAPVNRG